MVVASGCIFGLTAVLLSFYDQEGFLEIITCCRLRFKAGLLP